VVTSIKQAQKLAVYRIMSIKNATKQVFNLKDSDYRILGTIARLGYLNKNQIYDNLAYPSLRQIRWRIGKILFPGEFVFVKEKKSYRNIKNAFGKGNKVISKKYGLTMKGFLASLAFCPLKENYLIKEYRTWLTSKIENDVLEYIQIHLKLYFLTLKYQGIKLDYMVAPFAHLHETDLEILPEDVSKKVLKNFKFLRNDFYKLGLKIHKKIPHSKEGNEWTIITELWYNVIHAIIDGKTKSEILSNEMPKWHL